MRTSVFWRHVPIQILFLIVISTFHTFVHASFSTLDVYVPEQCDTVAKAGDHVLMEYRILFANGSSGATVKKPGQLYHILMDDSVSCKCLFGVDETCN